MSNVPILSGKHAVIFGAAGTIGAAVAREFAAAGAEVFLSGRTQSNVDALAKHITANGGKAHGAVVDTLDDDAVAKYINGVCLPVDGGLAMRCVWPERLASIRADVDTAD